MRMRPSLTADDAAAIVAAARAEATANGWAVTIVVVDEGGHLWRLDRCDGASRLSIDVATGKAITAAISGMATRALQEGAAKTPTLVTLKGLTLLQGGVPIIVDGECIGGVGVSGVRSHEDEQIAWAGAKALR